MQTADIRTADDARRLVEERNLSHVKVGQFDVDGQLRGKYVSRERFFAALDGGLNVCDVVLGWDLHDGLYDNVRFTGWHTGYPDTTVRILPETCRDIPFEDGPSGGGMVLFLAEFAPPAEALCPRGVLRRVVERAAGLGLVPHAALEYEFFLFDETPHSVREKGFRNLKPLSPGVSSYSVLRGSVGAEFYEELLSCCDAMRMPLEGMHSETGPSAVETALAVTEAVEAADRAALFKTFAKVVAQRRNLMATFMARWSRDAPGQSGHIHLSLRRADGSPVFHDPSGPHGMSTVMRRFVAGQQALMPELLAMIAPTVNSYTRLVPGWWAPTHACWGVENRTGALRVIPGSPWAQRVECRVAAADANPYLALAAAIGSGLWGIERELELPPGVTGNAYEHPHPPEAGLPASLWDAAQRLKASVPARTLFGDAFVEHFAASREWEEREFRKHVTDWELARYFEII